VQIREKMKIDEGMMLEVKEHPEGILLKPLPGIKAGRIAGREHDRKISELDQLRSEWR
jgi:bifunctional DNA-binding transcriptional regulator/antitoxin component of YhaV-PrlF toxin-antitoxin module